MGSVVGTWKVEAVIRKSTPKDSLELSGREKEGVKV